MILLLLHRIFEVPTQTLDLLDLLAKVRPQPGQLRDDIVLNVARLVGLGDGLAVVVAQDAVGFVEAAGSEEDGGRGGVVDYVCDFEEGFGAVLVAGLDFFEVGDEVFEELAPCCCMCLLVYL